MFTYFYNKFRPVNRVHYVKCGVNSSLLKYFWLLQTVCGTLDHCFIRTHSIHNEGAILQIYFGVIFRKTTHHAQAHIASGTLIYCALSLAARSLLPQVLSPPQPLLNTHNRLPCLDYYV